MTRIRFEAALLGICLFVTLASAANLRPLSGGTRTEPDPKEKKRIRVIAENELVRVTVGESERGGKFDRGSGIAAIWLKIENRTDEPLAVDPSTWSLVDDQGLGYSGLSIDVAADRLIGAKQGLIMIGSGIASGPGDAGHMHSTVEKMIRHNLEKPALKPGAIPARSFKEGVVYVEAPQIKKGTVKLNLAGIWPDPIILAVTD